MERGEEEGDWKRDSKLYSRQFNETSRRKTAGVW